MPDRHATFPRTSGVLLHPTSLPGPDGDDVHGYFNICPHQGTPLDLKPDVFLDIERKYIQCTTHSAQFQKHDGLCIAGPCAGSKLMKLPITVDDDGAVLLGS